MDQQAVVIRHQAKRGKFHHSDVELVVRVYLAPDVADFMRELSERKGTEIETIVNEWLRRNIDLVQSTK